MSSSGRESNNSRASDPSSSSRGAGRGRGRGRGGRNHRGGGGRGRHSSAAAPSSIVVDSSSVSQNDAASSHHNNNSGRGGDDDNRSTSSRGSRGRGRGGGGGGRGRSSYRGGGRGGRGGRNVRGGGGRGRSSSARFNNTEENQNRNNNNDESSVSSATRYNNNKKTTTTTKEATSFTGKHQNNANNESNDGVHETTTGSNNSGRSSKNNNNNRGGGGGGRSSYNNSNNNNSSNATAAAADSSGGDGATETSTTASASANETSRAPYRGGGRGGGGRARGRSSYPPRGGSRGGRGGGRGRGRSGLGRGRGRSSSRPYYGSDNDNRSTTSSQQYQEDDNDTQLLDDDDQGNETEPQENPIKSLPGQEEEPHDKGVPPQESKAEIGETKGAAQNDQNSDDTNDSGGTRSRATTPIPNTVEQQQEDDKLPGDETDAAATTTDATDTAAAAPKKSGKFLILSRPTSGKGPVITGTVDSHERLAKTQEDEDASTAQQQQPTHKKKTKAKKKNKKHNQDLSNNSGHDREEEMEVQAAEPVSTTDAFRALPAQEVSITANTAVKIRTNQEGTGGNGDNNNNNNQAAAAVGPRSPVAYDKSVANKKKTKSKKKKKGLSNDAEANRKAVQQFNRMVHQCVLQSDPDAMYELLHDPRNHNFALDAVVLEVVTKAYVMAAMFEDALYCLRHCTLPGTLDSAQTEHILSSLPQNLRNSSAYTAADMINALCIATNFDTPTSRTYFLRIVRGIALEFLEEATSARDRICSSPCERLVRAGLCVVNAHLKRGKKASDLLVEPGDQLGVFVPDSMENRGIQAGDAVSILPYAGPYPMSAESLDRNMIEATVTNTNPMVLRLQDKANATLYAMLTEPLDGNVYRIDKLANRMGFNRQLAAAVAIASPLEQHQYLRDPRRPSPELIRAITAMDENIDLVMRASSQGTAAGAGLVKGAELTSTAALCSQAIPWNVEDESEDMDQDAIRSECRLVLEKYGALEGLNGSQMLAVEGATSNRLTLVQGPPGTGKTLVAIRILQHWARLNSSSVPPGENPPPIMATSDSNIAVDNLVEGCAAVGLRVIRLGRPEAIRPELLRYCVDRPPSSYTNNSGGSNNNNNSSHDVPSSSMGSAVAVQRERLKQIKTEIKTAQVICCTCIGSGGDILDGMTFDRVLVDEATQATEPAVLVPLMRGCRQLVLVGDHCQLPPTVLSTRAEEEGHGVPLFSRMVACGVPPFLLDTQFRMHPRIAMFPSDLFYGGLLRNGVSAPERRPLAGFPWPVEEFPVAFIPVKGVEMDDGVSKFNEAEATTACDAVAMLMAGGQCRVSDIAVVTPYAAQAKLIRRMTRGLQQNAGPPFIEVSSVDGFQGREKEAVVFSAVRSNDYGAIGFTSDWRRVNVSFTRARRGLIVIGNDVTLRRGDPETWGPWLAWADAHGLNMDKPGVPRGRYDPEQLRRVRGGTTAAEMLKDVLERQQAQLKNAEKQQERAEKNAMGHIRATSEEQHEGKDEGDEKALTLEEDLAQMENAEGNWDDSDDDLDEEQQELQHSVSKATLTSHSSHDHVSAADDESNTVVDVWDL